MVFVTSQREGIGHGHEEPCLRARGGQAAPGRSPEEAARRDPVRRSVGHLARGALLGRALATDRQRDGRGRRGSGSRPARGGRETRRRPHRQPGRRGRDGREGRAGLTWQAARRDVRPRPDGREEPREGVLRARRPGRPPVVRGTARDRVLRSDLPYRGRQVRERRRGLPLRSAQGGHAGPGPQGPARGTETGRRRRPQPRHDHHVRRAVGGRAQGSSAEGAHHRRVPAGHRQRPGPPARWGRSPEPHPGRDHRVDQLRGSLRPRGHRGHPA